MSSELALLDIAAPGYLLINSMQEAEILCQTAELYAMSELILHNGLQALNPGCTHKMTKLLQETSHVPGIVEQIISTIEQASHGTGLAQAVHSSEKLEHALNLILSGEELSGYGSSIIEGSSTLFDYATESKVIKFIDQSVPSLKNIKPFESSRNTPLLSFQQNLVRKKELAHQAGKAFEVHFSGIIEREWAEWLAQEQIAYDFAHKIKLDNFLNHIISQEEWAELYEYAKQLTMVDPVSGQLVNPKINLEHIFLPEVKWFADGRVSGLHHDYMGLIDSSKIIGFEKFNLLKTPPHEFYMTNITSGIKKKPTSCFPKNWSRQELLENIIDALQNNIRGVKLQSDSKFRIEYSLRSEMKIDVIYNPASSTIETIFPNLVEFIR